MFTPLWDDEITQAEKEMIDSHFSTCESCRREYDEFARVLELVGSLPRVETSPEQFEATLVRARRSTQAPDHLVVRPAWLPVTASAALLIVVAALVTRWVGIDSGPWSDRPLATRQPARSETVTAPVVERLPSAPASSKEPVAGSPAAVDSLFDPNQDIEFVLDPVTLRRGRASVVRTLPAGIQADQAVVSF